MLQAECVRPPFRQKVTFPIAGLRAAVRLCEAPEVSHLDTPSRHFRSPLSSPGAMEITAGSHTRHTVWLGWSDFRGCPYRPTFCRTSSWVARLVTRSAVSPCCGSSRRLLAVRLRV